MHLRRRQCIGDIGVEKIGIHIEPRRRCIDVAARSTDTICYDPAWTAWTLRASRGLWGPPAVRIQGGTNKAHLLIPATP
eukprot:3136501-Pyramimonas_sp.AAC.1